MMMKCRERLSISDRVRFEQVPAGLAIKRGDALLGIIFKPRPGPWIFRIWGKVIRRSRNIAELKALASRLLNDENAAQLEKEKGEWVLRINGVVMCREEHLGEAERLMWSIYPQ